MPTQDTTDLIQGCLDRHKAGDAAAREEIARYCKDRLRRLVRRLLGRFPNVRRWEETSDVCQNVFMRLDRTLQQIPLATVRDFFQLASFHLRLELIDLANRYRHVREQPLNVPESADDSPDPVVLARWGEIHAYIAQMPDDLREPFDLIFYQGLTQPEAAKMLGLSLRTLKRRWQDARLRLMNWLGDDFSL
jgi:RNA polymerase sigma-70 factor (ECF subfamily)